MKIAITGGAGFIGTRLAALLQKSGHEIRILDIVRSPLFQNDPLDIRDLRATTDALKGVDVIYHLAAAHRDDVKPVSLYYDTNVEGTKNVCAAAKAQGIKTIVFTSTVALYGLNGKDSRETDTPDPFNDYGRSKLQAEEVLKDWARDDPTHSLCLTRLVATFGPGNRGNIFTLIDQIARRRFIMIGSGANRKTIAYVENVAAFLLHCLQFGAGTHLYNYADKPDLTAKEMVVAIRGAFGMDGTGPAMPYAVGIAGGTAFDIAAGITGRTFPVSAIRVRKFCADTVVNADKMLQTGFRPPYDLRTGLKTMIESDFQSFKKAA